MHLNYRKYTRVTITARKGIFSRTEYFSIELCGNHVSKINHQKVKSAKEQFAAGGWDVVDISFKDRTKPISTRPILFSGPMVMGILDGSKTQTRRLLKFQPEVQPYKPVCQDGVWMNYACDEVIEKCHSQHGDTQ